MAMPIGSARRGKPKVVSTVAPFRLAYACTPQLTLLAFPDSGHHPEYVHHTQTPCPRPQHADTLPQLGSNMSFKDTWAKLSHAIREIQNKNAPKISFEENHRYAYNMVLHKRTC